MSLYRKAFPVDQARHAVAALAELMEYANGREDGRWACQSSDPRFNGVYGYAWQTIKEIIRELHGPNIADRAEELLNIGGTHSWNRDVCHAVCDALDESEPY